MSPQVDVHAPPCWQIELIAGTNMLRSPSPPLPSCRLEAARNLHTFIFNTTAMSLLSIPIRHFTIVFHLVPCTRLRRPRSELTESPTGGANHVTAQTPPGSRCADHSDGGGSVRSDEGGLLGLILDTNEKEATRRRNRRLRHAEQSRRAYKSSPAKGVGREKDTDDCPKQQTPRQGTAEPAKVKIIRSKTMPPADSIPTTADQSGTTMYHPRGALPPSSSTTKRIDRSGSEDG